MLEIQTLTPFILLPELDAGIAFYEGLGFSCTFRGTEPGYAFMRAKGGAVRLLETDAPEAAAAARQHMVYLDVTDVDATYAALRPFLDTLPEDRVRAPFDQSYGQRELHVLDPGGTLLFFGQPIA
ncbi:VOC family protein [uncultured Jannaschia sp.]|uniref:VOC family protein n=1 Tax=uncultured Jannaschia sp. TaxID=293347 RepID=UPI0026351C59|nr:VOC family protein [uncultured Jannaschia sp.]